MKLSAIPRMTIGLVSLAVMLLLVFDLVLGVFPTEAEQRRQVQVRVANALAAQVAALLQTRDWRGLDQTLAQVRSQDGDLLSLAVRRADGTLLAQSGDHPASWPLPGRAAQHGLTVGLTANGQTWGQLEVQLRPLALADLPAWLFSPSTQLLLLFGGLSSLLYYVYLRRMLQHLDPASAVPDRVRSAFDTLVEGVVVVDREGRILLANKVFESLRPVADTQPLIGRRVQALGWLRPAEGDLDASPWLTAMAQRQPLRGLPFVVQVREDEEPSAHLVLNCSPLNDEQGGQRGCMVSVGDVTALELSHRQLLEVLADLATSKQALELKNDELAALANQDALSGCLNRRALFDLGESMLRRARHDGSPLVCVMADIDHFKKINDTWGHAVGDQAIQRFATLLRQHVRPGDLLGRYGGEEFCLVLPGATLERGKALAEALRQAVAQNRGEGLDPGEELAMSASFGVAELTDDVTGLAGLVDLADRAMYVAKKSGRNRVIAYAPGLEVPLQDSTAPATGPDTRPAAPSSQPSRTVHPQGALS